MSDRKDVSAKVLANHVDILLEAATLFEEVDDQEMMRCCYLKVARLMTEAVEAMSNDDENDTGDGSADDSSKLGLDEARWSFSTKRTVF